LNKKYVINASVAESAMGDIVSEMPTALQQNTITEQQNTIIEQQNTIIEQQNTIAEQHDIINFLWQTLGSHRQQDIINFLWQTLGSHRQDIINFLWQTLGSHRQQDIINFMRYTPLHLAVMLGYSDRCEFLIKEGIQVNTLDKSGLTGLYFGPSLDLVTSDTDSHLRLQP
jgi:Ankyrin repeat